MTYKTNSASYQIMMRYLLFTLYIQPPIMAQDRNHYLPMDDNERYV